MSDRVIVSFEDGVADVRMSRPDELNALDPAMFQALTEMGHPNQVETEKSNVEKRERRYRDLE